VLSLHYHVVCPFPILQHPRTFAFFLFTFVHHSGKMPARASAGCEAPSRCCCRYHETFSTLMFLFTFGDSLRHVRCPLQLQLPTRSPKGGDPPPSIFGRVGRVSLREYNARKILGSGQEWGYPHISLETSSRILLFLAVALRGRGPT
jgi:hypothetical protein